MNQNNFWSQFFNEKLPEKFIDPNHIDSNKLFFIQKSFTESSDENRLPTPEPVEFSDDLERIGTRDQVWRGTADITCDNYRKTDFTLNRNGKIVLIKFRNASLFKLLNWKENKKIKNNKKRGINKIKK